MRLLEKIPYLILILYCFFVFIQLLNNKEAFQWDFYSYYACVKAFFYNKINPYDTAVIANTVGKPIFNYVYPPITLQFFRLFTLFDYSTAFSIYLFLKISLLTILIYLWSRIYLQHKTGIAFYVFCLFAFNSSIYIDISAGNISLLEQALIWLAFLFYLRQQLIVFSILIILASVFKINPILFLTLLLLVPNKNKYIIFILSGLCFILIHITQYFMMPTLYMNFLTNAFGLLSEHGIINPSSFSFFRIASFLATTVTGIPKLDIAFIILYLIFIFSIISISIFALRILNKSSIPEKEKWTLFLMCFVYALLNVRFKDYSYILLIVPTYFYITRTSLPKGTYLVFILAIMSVENISLPGINLTAHFLWNYYPFLFTLLMFMLYILEIKSFIKKPHTHKPEITFSN